MTNQARLSWDSPKLLAVKKEWDSVWDTYAKTPERISKAKKDTYSTLVRMQGQLLRKRLSDEDARQLAASCGSLPIHCRDWSSSDNAVIEFMVHVFAYSRDRESLVTLLSTRFPLRIGNSPIELYLAEQVRLNDPIVILAEAYSKSRAPEVRHDIAAAVRRAFGGAGITGKDDADFIANAMQWYGKEKHRLVVDTSNTADSYYDPYRPLEPEDEYYEKVWHNRSLFIAKPDAERPGSLANRSKQPESQALDKDTRGTRPKQTSGRRAEDELAKLNGTWEVIEARDNAKPVPQEQIKGFRFVFRKETLTWIGPGGGKEDEFRIRLGSQQWTRAIDLLQTPKSAPKREETTALINELQEESTAGIYELKRDSLRICLPRRGAWQRPTSFTAEKGSGETVYTLKRVTE